MFKIIQFRNECTERKCPCCTATGSRTVFENELASISQLDMSYSVGVCRNCGFVFANRLPLPEAYAQYYQNLSKYDCAITHNEISSVDQTRASSTVDFIRNHISKDTAVIDLGCGVGTLLNAFLRQGWKYVYGIDPAINAPTRASALYGIDSVHCGFLSNAHRILPLHEAGLICLTGVVEHLWSPFIDLGQLVAHLNQEALVLIEVPDLEHFTDAPFEPFGEFSLEHLQYFSAHSLIRMLSSVGFSAEAIYKLELPRGTTNSLFGVFRRGQSSRRQLP